MLFARRPLAIACVLALVGGSASGLRAQAAGPDDRAADPLVAFRLKDQFGAEFDAAAYRGRPFYIVAAGRGGRGPATVWGTLLPRALAAAHAVPAPVLLVADLRGVPRLLRGLVRGRFPEGRRDAVLLDWGGALAGRVGLDRERCTVLAVSAAGRPLLRAVTMTADTAEVAAFVRRAGAVLAAGAGTDSATR